MEYEPPLAREAGRLRKRAVLVAKPDSELLHHARSETPHSSLNAGICSLRLLQTWAVILVHLLDGEIPGIRKSIEESANGYRSILRVRMIVVRDC